MNTIAITCLGAGAALGKERLWSSLLLDGQVLLEIPPTTVPQLYRLGVAPTAISHIFVSHLHADHFFGMPFFFLLFHYLHRQERPLYIIGPSGIRDATKSLWKLAWPDLEPASAGHGLTPTFVEVGDEGDYTAGKLAFSALKMSHFGLNAYGYRLFYKGRVIAYTGDTGPSAELDQLVEGADLLITEFTHAHDSDDPGHLNESTVHQLAECMRKRGKKTIATHLGGKPNPVDDLLICEDGETYIV